MTAGYDAQDRLSQYGNTTYTYTPNGELARKSVISPTASTTFTYNLTSKLTGVTLPNGSSIQYVLDGMDRRIGKKVNGVLVQGFLYANQLRPTAELDSNNQVVNRFVYAADGATPS